MCWSRPSPLITKEYKCSYELLDNICLGFFLGEVESRKKTKNNLVKGI